ncbi:MAG: DUF4097 family beta strand repeat-containing protein [Deinococcales bacterium]
MDETERIHKMVEAGTITDAEAERLLNVLQEIDDAERELAASGEAMEDRARQVADPSGAGSPSPSERSVPPETGHNSGAGVASTAEPAGTGTAAMGAAPPVPEPGARPPSAPAPATGAAAPEGVRWLHITLLAGDVEVRSVPGLDEVELAGQQGSVQLEPTADGYVLRHQRDGGGDSWVDRVLSRLRAGNVRVRVPEGFGVDLNVTAGDVDMDGVAYLRGRLTSGDLSAHGLKGIDFLTAAGDVDLGMTLTEGRHSVRATVGDVNIRLGAASSVAVEGSVSIGDASVRVPGFELDRHGIGQRFQGRMGDGAATLAVHVTTGDLNVKVRDER